MEIKLSDHFGYRKLFRFTMPSIIMMVFCSVYGVVDGVFVSNFIYDSGASFAAVNPPFISYNNSCFLFSHLPRRGGGKDTKTKEM